MKEVTIYTKQVCPYCVHAKQLLTSLQVPFKEIPLDENDELRQRLSEENNGWRTVPMIFIEKEFIGGFSDMKTLHDEKKLLPKLQEA